MTGHVASRNTGCLFTSFVPSNCLLFPPCHTQINPTGKYTHIHVHTRTIPQRPSDPIRPITTSTWETTRNRCRGAEGRGISQIQKKIGRESRQRRRWSKDTVTDARYLMFTNAIFLYFRMNELKLMIVLLICTSRLNHLSTHRVFTPLSLALANYCSIFSFRNV